MAREKFRTNVCLSSPPCLSLPSESLTRTFARLAFCFRCDAEPGALADYILALLKHYPAENELRTELTAQLEEFLEKGPSSMHALLPRV